MKIGLCYKDRVINIPAEAVEDNISRLTEDQMRVLLYLCSSPDFRADTDAGKAHAIKTLDMQWLQIEEALSSLASFGIISSKMLAENQPAETVKRPKASVKADRPVYTKDETSGIINRTADLKRIINSDVPRLIGKSVTQNEAAILVTMYDYLRFSPECIIKIVSYCRMKQSFSFRFIERTAYTLFDADVTTPEKIEEYIKEEERREHITAKIRELFGIGSRALVAREKTHIKNWTEVYGYDMDMIERAYEITINSVKEPSLDYTAAILKRWHDNGIKTPDDVASDQSGPLPEVRKRSKKEKTVAQSFDPDEFADAAFRRSYGVNGNGGDT